MPNVVAEKYAKAYRGRYQGKPIPDKFFGMIANIDENIGKLEAFLAAKNLRENTILVFMSDNGTQSAGAQKLYNAGMRDRKTSVMEGGHRVPCFVRWPAGRLKHGRNVDQLTTVQDILPTPILCVERHRICRRRTISSEPILPSHAFNDGSTKTRSRVSSIPHAAPRNGQRSKRKNLRELEVGGVF